MTQGSSHPSPFDTPQHCRSEFFPRRQSFTSRVRRVRSALGSRQRFAPLHATEYRAILHGPCQARLRGTRVVTVTRRGSCLGSRYAICRASAMEHVWTQAAAVAEIALRLFAALATGALIGWDREREDKPAGLRTHLLVALGSACFTLLGFRVGEHLESQAAIALDPTRVLQGLIGGIGFLGAGAIIRDGASVSGLTTAASVWIVGALGAACGVGAFSLALLTAALAFLVLRLVRKLPIERAAERERKRPPEPEA